MAELKWLINGGDPNYLRYVGANPFSFQQDAVNLSHFQPLLSAKPLEAPGKFEGRRTPSHCFVFRFFQMEIVPKSEELSVRFWYKCANNDIWPNYNISRT